MKHHEDSYSTKFSLLNDCDDINDEFENEASSLYDSDDNVHNSVTLGSASSVYYSLSSIATEASETCLSFFVFLPLPLSVCCFPRFSTLTPFVFFVLAASPLTTALFAC